MKNILIALNILLAIQFGNSQMINEGKFAIGDVIEFKSEILNENRVINIYLPASYGQDSVREYPVIYLLDGSRDEDFIHVSGLVQFCSFPWINIIDESIVVGIANVDRKRDFTYPSTMEIDQKEFPTSGKSKLFMQFISDELQGIISKRYRTTGSRTLIGQSVGGLMATEILFKQPHLFDNYIIMSPSLWWDDELLLKYKLNESLKGKSVYVGVGKEGPTMERLARNLFHKLSLEKKDELKLYYNYFENQDHGDVLHLALYNAFEKLFKKETKKN